MVVCNLKCLVIVYDMVGHLGYGCSGKVLGMDCLLGGFIAFGELRHLGSSLMKDAHHIYMGVEYCYDECVKFVVGE